MCIVRRAWVQQCFARWRKLDEGPYLLDGPTDEPPQDQDQEQDQGEEQGGEAAAPAAKRRRYTDHLLLGQSACCCRV